MSSPVSSLYSPGGLPAPDLDDEPNVPSDLMALAVALDPMVETRFASTQARDLNWAASVAPLGARCLVTTNGRRYVVWSNATGRQWYELRGAALVVANVGERDALTPKPPGMRAYVTGTGETWEVDSAAAWIPFDVPALFPPAMRANFTIPAIANWAPARAWKQGRRCGLKGTAATTNALAANAIVAVADLPPEVPPPAGLERFAISVYNGTTDAPALLYVTSAGIIQILSSSAMGAGSNYTLSGAEWWAGL